MVILIVFALIFAVIICISFSILSSSVRKADLFDPLLIISSMISLKTSIVSQTGCLLFAAAVLVSVIFTSHMLQILAFNASIALMPSDWQYDVMFDGKGHTLLLNLSITKLTLLSNA
jgi:hypothetical protein